MKTERLSLFWSEIPVGKENAITYAELCKQWSMSDRAVRHILHDLSAYDSGDDYILIRSSCGKGFYKTDDKSEIIDYRSECLNRGRRTFAPLRKIDRVLTANNTQFNIENNLRVVRVAAGLKQTDVCNFLKKYDSALDESMLSRFENGVCLPTHYQLSLLADFYAVEANELIRMELYC